MRNAAVWSCVWIALALAFGVYIGVKMLLSVGGLVHIPPLVSLGVVLGLLVGGAAASFIWPEKKEEADPANPAKAAETVRATTDKT